ncbi:hypothetical protein ACFSVJ_01850 [Prauserella oleivorans]
MDAATIRFHSVRGPAAERRAGERTSPPSRSTAGARGGHRTTPSTPPRPEGPASTGPRRVAGSATRRRHVESSPERPDALSSTGSQDALTATGSHRAVGRKPKRRVAAWPIACLVLVGLLVAGWFGWNWADGVVASRAEAQAAACDEGEATLRVAVAPAAMTPVRQAAKTWNDAKTVVHGHCITVDLRSAPSERVLTSLTGAGATGDVPAAWIAEDPSWIDRLRSQQADRIGSTPETLAQGPKGTFTYVSLTGDGVDGVQERAAQSFRSYLLEPAQRRHFTAAGLIAH